MKGSSMLLELTLRLVSSCPTCTMTSLHVWEDALWWRLTSQQLMAKRRSLPAHRPWSILLHLNTEGGGGAIELGIFISF